jgi:hypothetical protein
MEGLANGKRGKMCSIATESGRGGKKIIDASEISFGNYNLRIQGVGFQKLGF